MEWSPLFAESLREGKARLDQEPAPAESDSEDAQAESGYVPQYTTFPCDTPTTGVTCYTTCGTCPTTGTTCGTTCLHTCDITCGTTCLYTCGVTCGTTCAGTTCGTTCGSTCSSTCGTTCGTCSDDPPPPPPPDEEIPDDPYVVGDTTFWPLHGPDRYQTAVAISQDGWDSAETVIIATGRNWPDALGGAGLAGALGAPILLSDTNNVPDVTMAEIERLGAGRAIILGGEAAVGAAARAELAGVLGTGNVERIGGANRYETAELIARAIVDLDIDPLIFSDDMSDLSNWLTSDHDINPWTLSTERFVSPPTSAGHIDYVNDEVSFLDLATPLDLSHARSPELRASVWYDLEENFDFFGVIATVDGGDSWTTLANYTGDSGGFEEIVIDLSDLAGEPSVLISFGLVSDQSNDSNDGYRGVWVDDVSVVDPGSELAGTVAFVATGANFPDALAAAPVAATAALPLLLCRPGGTAPVDVLQQLGVERVLVLGGAAVVSAEQEDQLKAAFGAANVERLAGTSRYATAVEVATWGVDAGICGWNGLALATGERFPDALTGGALQARYASVMLLTRSQSLPPETATALAAHQEDIAWMAFLGGASAISVDVRTEVESIVAQ